MAQSTLLCAPRGGHSRKPEAFYQRVESLCPGSKLELFARRPRTGWSSWGDEI
ncbi:MAG: MT-A70 family methyltransferase [Gammaproteobacteria bacterium]